jgi:hypothetical protein
MRVYYGCIIENTIIKEMDMSLDELRSDVARKQKKGLPFIGASVVIWLLILITCSLNLPIRLQNMIVFCCSCPLMPLAMLIGKIIHVDIFDKSNELGNVGFLFTLNQFLYLLIVMWVFSAVPGKMVMVYAMVFGAHLLPYSWLYKSVAYRVFAIIIPVISLVIGCMYPAIVVAAVMLIIELIFVVCLIFETKKI